MALQRVARCWAGQAVGPFLFALPHARLVFITFIIKVIIRLLLLCVYEFKFMPLLLYGKLFVSIIISTLF